MKKPQLTSTEYNWLINLLDKDILATRDCFTQEPHPLLKLRIENMESLKARLYNIRDYDVQRAAMLRKQQEYSR